MSTGITLTIVNNVVIGASYSGDGSKTAIIPDSVTAIGDSAFYQLIDLTDVVIPSSVTSIGEYAFLGTGLTSIVIPNTVTSFGQRIFQSCVSLTGVEIQGSVIGDFMFTGCTEIIDVTISNIKSIGGGSFDGCTKLTSIVIPSSVTSLGDYALASTGLTSIVIPSFVTSLGEYSFYGCNALTSVTIQGSVIGNGMFAYCYLLTDVTIFNSVTSIGDYAFQNCSNLRSVVIPDFVTTIGNYAFNSSGLYGIDIPNSVTSIGDESFSECNSLSGFSLQRTCHQGLTVLGSRSFYISPGFGGEFDSSALRQSSIIVLYEQGYYDKQITDAGCDIGFLYDPNIDPPNPYDEEHLGGPQVPVRIFVIDNANTITNIPYQRTNIIIPTYVTSINPASFNTIRNTVRNICFPKNINIPNIDGVFQDCIEVTSLEIPTSVASIGANTFTGCTSLSSVSVSSIVSNIDSTAFTRCNNVKLEISGETDTISANFLKDVSQVTEVTIPSSITSIGSSAFKNSGIRRFSIN